MTIEISEETEIKFDFDYEEVIRRVILAAMDFEECPYEAEVSVTITDNAGIHEINRDFRQIDAPTDVLSFPMIEYENPGDFAHVEDDDDNFNPETGELLLGDIVLNQDRIFEQSESFGHSVTRELAFLTAHSMFHLFGYDHMEDDEREEMEDRQKRLLEELGINR